jgi:hypothetical protein
MTTIRDQVTQVVWGESDPFKALAPQPDRVDFQGWHSSHVYLSTMIDEIRPRIVVEVGVWKGGSVITMAEHLRLRGLDSVVIAVDTWLGSWEHWLNPDWFSQLRVEAGYPTMFRTFAANISARGLEPYVTPLPLDSNNAAFVLRAKGVHPGLVHIDAGHDFQAVTNDLKLWWPLIAPGGAMIGDDYNEAGGPWPEVREAIHAFFNVDAVEHFQGKCIVRKDLNGQPAPMRAAA